MEDEARKDSGEGTLLYNSGFAQGIASSEDMQEIASRSSMKIEGDFPIELNGNELMSVFPDAYLAVLCSTAHGNRNILERIVYKSTIWLGCCD